MKVITKLWKSSNERIHSSITTVPIEIKNFLQLNEETDSLDWVTGMGDKGRIEVYVRKHQGGNTPVVWSGD